MITRNCVCKKKERKVFQFFLVCLLEKVTSQLDWANMSARRKINWLCCGGSSRYGAVYMLAFSRLAHFKLVNEKCVLTCLSTISSCVSLLRLKSRAGIKFQKSRVELSELNFINDKLRTSWGICAVTHQNTHRQ